MSQLFRRKPIAALIASEGTDHSLKRVLGAGDLVMLAIGAVIGAGIFGAIGTAAAGQTDPNGEVIRYGAGPALVFSFLLLGGACALAALCQRPRPFRVPLVWVIAPLGAAACAFIMVGLPPQAWERFGAWLFIGLIIYAGYGYSHSRLRGA